MRCYWKENKKQSYQDFADLCIRLYEKRFGHMPTIGINHKNFQPVADGVVFSASSVNINELLLGE